MSCNFSSKKLAGNLRLGRTRGDSLSEKLSCSVAVRFSTQKLPDLRKHAFYSPLFFYNIAKIIPIYLSTPARYATAFKANRSVPAVSQNWSIRAVKPPVTSTFP